MDLGRRRWLRLLSAGAVLALAHEPLPRVLEGNQWWSPPPTVAPWPWTSASADARTSTSTSTTAATTTTTTWTSAPSTARTRTTTSTTSPTTTGNTTTSSTSTSSTGPHVFGGSLTDDAFEGWLSVWRSKYEEGLWKAGVPDPYESSLPEALRNVTPLVVASSGGVASGVVSEGMGYGIMMEGFLAVRGCSECLDLGLSLLKSWQGLVQGPSSLPHPYAGGSNYNDSSTKVDSWPYGVSAVEGMGAAGVPAWKFPIEEDDINTYMGSAADGDQDALLGMIYLAAAMEYPDDMVDMVVRTLVSFVSADLGFPDLYRTLPCGRKIFVPKLGSMWGGLLPPGGKYKTKQEPWCYSPGYFAPAHYRTFRDFAKRFWRPEFDAYLPPHLDGTAAVVAELVEALDSAVTAGYNILYYSSCESGSVSNWVGVEAPCEHDETLNCSGVPWRHTPWVGPHGGKCAESGTLFGSFGADATRAAWRIAMDYVLFRDESSDVTIYDRDGNETENITFGAQVYMNRIVKQYKFHALCDGGVDGDCMNQSESPFELAHAFDPAYKPPDVTCPAVPIRQTSWWAGFMAYPTFTAFVAPYDEIGEEQMSNWMDTFSRICNFSDVNLTDFESGGPPTGKLCLTSYFEASQAVISFLIMSGKLSALPKQIVPSSPLDLTVEPGDEVDVLRLGAQRLDAESGTITDVSPGVVGWLPSMVAKAAGFCLVIVFVGGLAVLGCNAQRACRQTASRIRLFRGWSYHLLDMESVTSQRGVAAACDTSDA